jgi:hypothetical protein
MHIANAKCCRLPVWIPSAESLVVVVVVVFVVVVIVVVVVLPGVPMRRRAAETGALELGLSPPTSGMGSFTAWA